MLTLGWALACNGTSTGNPMDGNHGGGSGLGKGMELLTSDVAREVSPDVDESDAVTLGADGRSFAFDLYRQLATPEQNLFFSPFSVSVALAMTYDEPTGQILFLGHLSDPG